MLRIPSRLLGGLLLIVLGSAAAHAAVFETRLDNGLKVLVKPDHRAPVVVSQIWYKVGSSYEPDGISGISHMLEHMMFKGTPKHPAGQFSRIIAEQGGSENAFTSRDYTAYFQQLEKSRLPIAFGLEADRMRNLSLKESDFVKERQVVMEERRMRTEDKPEALTSEQFLASAYLASPYRQPVIGWMADIRHLSIGELRQWYHRWYAPNNATLVVVGDVEPKAVFALAKKYFGPIKPSKIVEPKPRPEPKQLGERRIIVKVPAEVPTIFMGYKVPVLHTAKHHWEAYALDVAANILDGGDSARLTRDLIRGSQVAAGASADYDLGARLSSLFTLQGVPAQGHSVAEVEKALRGEVARLREKLVEPDELARVKAQVKASKVYQLDSVFYQAMQIGMLETVGLGYKVADEYVKAIDAVTPEQVREVARRYLTDDRLTVAVLQPQSIKDKEEK